MKLIVGCLLCFFTFAVAAADLRMLTDNHPPLHFQQGSELVGFGVDVALSGRADRRPATHGTDPLAARIAGRQYRA